jgi:thioredoxin reductase
VSSHPSHPWRPWVGQQANPNPNPRDILHDTHAELHAYKGYTDVDAEVVELKKTTIGFKVIDNLRRRHQGRQAILAHGVKDHLPGTEGYAEVWGKAM